MPSDRVNLELIVARPGGSRVVQDYLAGNGAAMAFFGSHFADAGAYSAKATEVDGRFDRAGREAAVRAITTPPGADPARLERFVEEGGYVVTTGQQPGLIGGPLYSVYKGLTAARLAAALETRLGKPVLPLFWVASEDHDWDEANHTYLVGLDNELHRPTATAPDPDRHPPLHRIPLGDSAPRLVEQILQVLPDSDFSSPYLQLIRDSITAESTLPQSFRAIMEALLGPFGVFFTDAGDPALKRASAPLLAQELARAEELEGVLAATGSELDAAGYGTQVALMPGGVNLFLEGPAGRERLYRHEAGFRLRSSGEELTAEEIQARTAGDPSILSPNVLLRPVVESAVFPTLSYVAGPGEMAYYAQIGGYFQALGIQMPVIYPRFGATAVETKIRKVLTKFDMDVADLHRPFHEIAGDIARDEVPPEVKKALGGLRGAIGKGVGELTSAVKAVDPTLKGTVQHVRSQSFAALDDLEKKVVLALKRENEIALTQLEKAQLHLFPEGKPQERVMNLFYYLARYGGAFLEEVHERFEVNLD